MEQELAMSGVQHGMKDRALDSSVEPFEPRLADGCDARSLFAAGKLDAVKLDALAAVLVRTHGARAIGAPVPLSRRAWITHCTGTADQELLAFEGAEHDLAPSGLIARVRERLQAFAREHPNRFERRRRRGRAASACADLRLSEVRFEREGAEPLVGEGRDPGGPSRPIDVAEQVASLAMDLCDRGASALAERFVNDYARASGDFDLYSVIDYFIACRAIVRAKSAALAASDPVRSSEQRSHKAERARSRLALADAVLEPRVKPALVLVGGAAGAGKNEVAHGLAECLGGVVVAAEQQLFERARPVLESGRAAILVRSFGRRARREAAVRFACKRHVAVVFVEARAGAANAPEIERPSEWPAQRCAQIRTDRGDWLASLPGLAAWVLSHSH
jgi:hypothetical protein